MNVKLFFFCMNRIQNRSFPVEGITDPCTLAFSSIYSQLGIDRLGSQKQFCLCVCVLIYTVIRTKMTFKYAGFLLKKLIKTIKRLYWFFCCCYFASNDQLSLYDCYITSDDSWTNHYFKLETSRAGSQNRTESKYGSGLMTQDAHL